MTDIICSSTTAAQPQDVGIATFIHNIFVGLTPDERVCLSLSGANGKFASYPATERRLRQFRSGQAPWYFCISSVAPPSESGYLSRTHAALKKCYCIVLDDIGTKAKEPPVAPSWILESSEGNYQWGYLLDVIDLTPTNLAYVEGCVRGLALAGYSDAGARGAYRIMRVPGSLHKTGFVSRITSWEPDRSWALPELMEAMGVECVEQRIKRKREAVAVGTDEADPVLDWLVSQDMVLGESRDWVFISCPWGSEHSTDTVGSTSYSPVGRGGNRAFSCLHSHGDKYRTKEFMDWVAENGGPDTTPVALHGAKNNKSAPELFGAGTKDIADDNN